VKRISKADFPVVEEGRRAGDPPEIVATGQKLRELLGWTPRYNRLDVIVQHALAWEAKLKTLK
jgi:UDP-glucose 4-epimerase